MGIGHFLTISFFFDTPQSKSDPQKLPINGIIPLAGLTHPDFNRGVPVHIRNSWVIAIVDGRSGLATKSTHYRPRQLTLTLIP